MAIQNAMMDQSGQLPMKVHVWNVAVFGRRKAIMATATRTMGRFGLPETKSLVCNVVAPGMRKRTGVIAMRMTDPHGLPETKSLVYNEVAPGNPMRTGKGAPVSKMMGPVSYTHLTLPTTPYV